MRVGIVGAGMAGLACAERLARDGGDVSLFDKGKRPGGRLASVAIDHMSWDIGAQYFTARDPRFVEQVEKWLDAGWVAPWPDGPGGAFVGLPSMASLVAAQCARFDARFGSPVRRIERDAAGWHVAGEGFREGPFSALVVAVPAEQAAALLALQDLGLARDVAAVRSTPCWTAMVAYAEPVPGQLSALYDRGPFARAIRSRSKPGRGPAECWVLQAGADWSRAHLDMPRDEIAALLQDEFAAELGCTLPPAIFAKAHLWRFALPFGQHGAPIWNEALRLGACGDWCIGPTIEEAWLSGHALAAEIMEALCLPAAAAAARS